MATATTQPLLEATAEEIEVLQRIAAGDSVDAQRAAALAALAGGADLEAAGKTAGLTANQVRFWLGRFRSQRLAVFPESLLLAAAEAAAGDREPEPPMLAAPEAAPLLAAPEKVAELPPPADSAADGKAEAVAAVGAVAAATAVKKSKKKKKSAKKDGKKKKKNSKKDKKMSKKKDKKKNEKKGKNKDKKNGKKKDKKKNKKGK